MLLNAASSAALLLKPYTAKADLVRTKGNTNS